MSIFVTTLCVYFVLGFLLLLFNPAKQVFKDVFFKFSMTNRLADAVSNKKLSVDTRILIFKIAIIAGFILLWPILYSGIIKEYKKSHGHIENISTEEGFGVKFSFMGGHGALSCRDCNFSQELTSFTHGYHQGDEGLHKCSTSGYQCQSCGMLTTRSEIQPFVKSEHTETLKGVPIEQRANVIDHMLFMVKMCKDNMKKTPKKRWLGTWEPTVIQYSKELENVSTEEINIIEEKQKAHNEACEAALVCECGGKLDREELLFCPDCKSKSLDYDMHYIT